MVPGIGHRHHRRAAAVAPNHATAISPSSTITIIIIITAAPQGYLDFFESGKLLTMASLTARVDVFDDAEYLGGVIQLAQELGNYAVGQAIGKDTTSIQVCRVTLFHSPKRPPITTPNHHSVASHSLFSLTLPRVSHQRHTHTHTHTLGLP